MSFSFPWALVLLLLVPVVLVFWHRCGRPALRYSQTQAAALTSSGRAYWARRGGWILRGGGLTLLVLAAAGPRWPDPGSRLPTEGISVAMVVDVSSSMAQRDFLWEGKLLSRLDAVKKVFRLFLEGGAAPDGIQLPGRRQDLAALVTFAGRPETDCPLTLDHRALLEILDAEEPRTLAPTNPGDALAWALGRLHKAPTRRKVIVFLTDGESNVPPPALGPQAAAHLAASLGVPIYAIEAGQDEAAEIAPTERDPKGQHMAAESLQKLAKISGGRYFRAADLAALLEACHAIDALERDRIQSFEYRRHYEGFLWFALVALAGWLGLAAMEATWWRTAP